MRERSRLSGAWTLGWHTWLTPWPKLDVQAHATVTKVGIIFWGTLYPISLLFHLKEYKLQIGPPPPQSLDFRSMSKIIMSLSRTPPCPSLFYLFLSPSCSCFTFLLHSVYYNFWVCFIVIFMWGSAAVHTWWSEDNLWESVPSFQQRILGIKLGQPGLVSTFTLWAISASPFFYFSLVHDNGA